MPLNKLDNFIKNTEGRILYVSPSDLDSTDSITNQGNSLAQPFKTLQRAILEAARFSYIAGNSNDVVEKTTILLMPGEHPVDNRPGFTVYDDEGTAKVISPQGTVTVASDTLSLNLSSNFDLTQSDNILYKFNSINGGVIVPRGTSIVGLDLRKTKIRPKYVPNPTDSAVNKSSIFKITGACYFWQFCIFDGNEKELVYTDPQDFSTNNQSVPTFSHHKLTCFEYADGTNKVGTYGLTDLDMYYSKLSNAFNQASGREIPSPDKFPLNPAGLSKQRPEWEIVGAFAPDFIQITSIQSGTGGVASPEITVTTAVPHELTEGTPIKIKGVSVNDYNVSTKVSYVDPNNSSKFKFLLPYVRPNLPTNPDPSGSTVTIETDTVSGASPYIFNISLRSIWGMNGMHADGSKASGFRSMVVAQFTGVSLQKDDRAFAKYNSVNREYETIAISKVTGSSLSNGASSTEIGRVYHLDSQAIYRNGWESSHIKASNDSFIQIVSVFAIGFNKHFDVQTGSDLSITNSNSNFGQISLSAYGFKKQAFAKDNKAFITSIVTPKSINNVESNIDWSTLDVAKTISVSINPNQDRLYLYGYTSKDDIPPVLTQGYRIGAKLSDKLFIVANQIEYSANILMSDGVTSSVKQYSVGQPSSNTFTISSGTHNIETGEKVIILSDIGDLPENIVANTTYYAIKISTTQLQLASSSSNASAGIPITVYKGTSLKIFSRVSDKNAGDIGSPVQYDSTNSNWYIQTNATSGIWTALNTLGVAALGSRTEPSYIKRISDSRSIDEKIYKLRVEIPKELTGAKKPENGFIIQESSKTGVRSDTDFNLSTISSLDYDYNRNPRFIAKCTVSSTTVTVTAEQPHNLRTGDIVIIKNVTDTSTAGTEYNGTYQVTVVDDMTFTYSTTEVDGTSHTPGSFTNNTNSRTTSLPRFEKNDLQSNLYIYRNEVINDYIEGIQDGIYHIYTLNSQNAITKEFTNLKYSQNVVDLYPQLDRDNVNDNPSSAKSYAKVSPIGDVVTSDLKNSITRETIDSALISFGQGLDISAVSSNNTSATITFDKPHGFSGIVTYSSLTSGSGHTPGTYYNVKLYNNSGLTSWNGATATVFVSAGGVVTSLDITSSGSAYSAGTLYVDNSSIGGAIDVSATFTTAGISTSIGDVIQFTGSGITTDTYHRITSVPSTTSISIAKTAGDPAVTTDQYAFLVSRSVAISTSQFNSGVGIATITCSAPHGLLAGNKFRIISSANNNIGDYIADTIPSVSSVTVLTSNSINLSSPRFILKHGLSSNNAISDSSQENVGVRDFTFFEDEILTVVSFTSDTLIRVLSPTSSSGITKRFPLGSYIQIDNEIMRITSSTLGGGFNDAISVIRGVFGTIKTDHDSGSLIKKIKPIPVEFRRPAILRASGHTFEYLGYGPGNYSTGLPQVQIRSLTEREDFLVQSQERSGGLVVYTGMNNNGDVFNGNTKTSASSGEVTSFDIPRPTVTGADPSRSSVVFDEVTIKERLAVEGGNSGTVLSQFDGPVTFNKEIKINNTLTLTKQSNSTSSFTLKVNDSTNDSTSSNTGSVIISGGVGIGKNLNVGANLGITGATKLSNTLDVVGISTLRNRLIVGGASSLANTLYVSGITTINSTLNVTSATTVDALNINTATPFAGTGDLASSGGADGAFGIYNITSGGSISFNLKNSGGSAKDILTLTYSTASVGGDLNVTGDITAFYTSDQRLKENIVPIPNALDKVISISGNTFDWVEGSGKEGLDVGVVAQEILEVLPEAVITRDSGYLAVNYEKIVPLLIEAIKELSKEVKDLRDQINNK